jgi:hypothetical protein
MKRLTTSNAECVILLFAIALCTTSSARADFISQSALVDVSAQLQTDLIFSTYAQKFLPPGDTGVVTLDRGTSTVADLTSMTFRVNATQLFSAESVGLSQSVTGAFQDPNTRIGGLSVGQMVSTISSAYGWRSASSVLDVVNYNTSVSGFLSQGDTLVVNVTGLAEAQNDSGTITDLYTAPVLSETISTPGDFQFVLTDQQPFVMLPSPEFVGGSGNTKFVNLEYSISWVLTHGSDPDATTLSFDPGISISPLAPAVPEPASLSLLGVGIAGLAIFVWRSRMRYASMSELAAPFDKPVPPASP